MLGVPQAFSKPPKILIVDDNEQNVELVCAMMEAEGYEVLSAPDGLEAIARVAANPPELILLDIKMPKLDGYEVCRQLKARPETLFVPIVLIAALRGEADKILGIEVGGRRLHPQAV